MGNNRVIEGETVLTIPYVFEDGSEGNVLCGIGKNGDLEIKKADGSQYILHIESAGLGGANIKRVEFQSSDKGVLMKVKLLISKETEVSYDEILIALDTAFAKGSATQVKEVGGFTVTMTIKKQ